MGCRYDIWCQGRREAYTFPYNHTYYLTLTQTRYPNPKTLFKIVGDGMYIPILCA